MNKILIVITALVFGACAQTNEGTVLVGKVNVPLSEGEIRLERLTETGLELVSTIELDGSNEFEYSLILEEPTFFRMSFYDRQQLNLILTKEDGEVNIEVDGDRPMGLARVEGSKHTAYLIQIDEIVKKSQQDVQLLNQEAGQARMNGDVAAFEEIVDQYEQVTKRNNEALKETLSDMSPSLAVFYGLNNINFESEFEYVDALSQELSEALPNHPFAVDLKNRIDAMRLLAVGSPAPEISLPSPGGDIISLSSLKGNYVLIDFWAAWCRPCRAENPNVVRLYKQYQDKNFEILGVSLDRKREHWLKAIEDDGLIWNHVSDLQYFNSQAAQTYQITAIPATYLIDPEGNIVAKGLRGKSLEDKLKEIFG